MSSRTCLICGDDYTPEGFVQCGTCTFESCGVCLGLANYDCSQCRTPFKKDAEKIMTNEQFAIITKSCFVHGKIAGGETGLEKANRILLRKIGIAEEDLRLCRLQNEDNIQRIILKHERIIQLLQEQNQQLQEQNEIVHRRVCSEFDDSLRFMHSKNQKEI